MGPGGRPVRARPPTHPPANPCRGGGPAARPPGLNCHLCPFAGPQELKEYYRTGIPPEGKKEGSSEPQEKNVGAVPEGKAKGSSNVVPEGKVESWLRPKQKARPKHAPRCVLLPAPVEQRKQQWVPVNRSEPVLICSGKYCPRIWVCGESSVMPTFLRENEVTVIVRCLRGGGHPNLTTECHEVKAAVFALPPGPLISGHAIAMMCKEIDHHRGSGAVTFYCRAGRHRSFAAAVAYILWCCRAADLETVVKESKALNDRFELLSTQQFVKGKPRRPLMVDLRNWENTLRNW